MVANHRETVSGITHLIAAVLAGIGLIWLLIMTHGNLIHMFLMFLYGVSLIAVFSASARIHLSDGSPEHMLRLRRHDHAAIYFVIAGTYTPMIVLLLDGVWQWIILATIWAMCLYGIYWKLSKLQGRNNSIVSTAIYVAVGWFALLSAPLWLSQVDKTTLALITSGGIIYSVGAIIFALQRPNLARHFGFHELWHILVMIASLLHYLAIVRVVTMVSPL